MKHYFFFDLDGTLTDSAEGIINCVKHALDLQTWPYPSPEELRPANRGLQARSWRFGFRRGQSPDEVLCARCAGAV